MSENEKVVKDQNEKDDESAPDAKGREADSGHEYEDKLIVDAMVADDDKAFAALRNAAGEEIAGDAEVETRPADGVDVSKTSWITPAGLPRYKCHKTVTAFQIASAEALSNGRVQLVGGDTAHSIIVDSAYVDKHHPRVGGYYVRYHDGYESWSPAKAFEAGYTLETD